MEWRRNAGKLQWELVDPGEVAMYDDDAPVYAFVTDELIERVADPRMVAMRMRGRVGTVPPPLAKLLEDQDDGSTGAPRRGGPG